MAPHWQTQDSFYELGHGSNAPPSGFRAVKNVWYARARAHVTQYRRFYLIISILSVCCIITFTLLGRFPIFHGHCDRHRHGVADEQRQAQADGGVCDPATFDDTISNVAIYIAGAPLNIMYPQASEAKECCEACHEMSPSDGHCNAWGYIGGTCTNEFDYPGSGKDDTCPQGYPRVTIEHNKNRPGDTGGYGPCAAQSKS
ncbi:hypothetical protein PG996_006100 [Apiospora saccharicola]|uniref:Uncharacterized protein n=1 Tax=Apiospora saccharicola TaxID=335842 RepID=A0ABR1VNE4_9PEZI